METQRDWLQHIGAWRNAQQLRPIFNISSNGGSDEDEGGLARGSNINFGSCNINLMAQAFA